MNIDILEVLSKKYQTELNHTSNEQGHWLLRDGNPSMLYSQSKMLTGSEVLEQITTMQQMIDRLTEAQRRLVDLIKS